MVVNPHKKYIADVKEWAGVVEQLLQENNINDPALLEWKSQVDDLIHQLEEMDGEALQESEQLMIVEEQTRQLYEGIQTRYMQTDNRKSVHKIPHGGHKLPPLPYPYDALEPYISEQIMRLHHDKHHQSYVEGLNKAEEEMKKARNSGDYSLLKHWEREAAFNGSGHYLHSIFWENMNPDGGGKPKGALLNQIETDFGSFEGFKNHFSEAANKVEGVGWALMVWSPRSRRLEILQSEKHQHFTQWDTIPLLVLDVWEHAYYLQYQNERKKYINNWWNIVNWEHVSERYNAAKKLKWTPL